MRTKKIPSPSRIWLALALLAAAVAIAWHTRRIEAWLRQPLPAVATPSYGAFLASRAPSGEPELDLERARVPFPIELRQGHNLGDLLAEHGLEPGQVGAVVSALDGHIEVRKLRPGMVGLAYMDREAGLESLRLDVGVEGWVELTRAGGQWLSERHQFVRETRIRRIEGKLEGLLIDEVRRAGGRQQVAYEMANVLQWDLDFNRDLRIGDRFRVLYEEVYHDGDYTGLGEILALEYDNRGHGYQAYRFGERGYYDADGRPVQKMFLRSPLPFTRVTSRFSNRRFHPILKVHRPHYGVDYGAPRGTPVRVTAGGTVTFAGRSGGAGKMVKVRHTNGYVTSYLHLHGYARGIRRGRRVAQGDVIGYVGSTGLSTAPHLDYRVKKNGRWMDPLRLKSDPVDPIPEHRLDQYLARRDQLLAALDSGRMPEPPLLLAARGPAARGPAALRTGEAGGR